LIINIVWPGLHNGFIRGGVQNKDEFLEFRTTLDSGCVNAHSELHPSLAVGCEVQSAKSTTPNRYSKDNRDINY